MPPPDPRHDRAALIAAVCCFTAWGFLPLLFQAVGRAGAGSAELVAWRVTGSVPVVAILVLATGQARAALALLTRPKMLGSLAVSSLLIGTNWGVYVWAVQHGQTLSASLGYYINPLINVVFGAWLFRERLSRAARVALGLAAAGVAIEAWAIGGAPWIALTLACSFATYGVIRKTIPAEAQTGLFVETLLLAIPTTAYLIWLSAHGGGAFGRTPAATWLLLSTAPATVLPLAAFSLAARRLPLSLIGFIQFLQPTLLFAVGVFGGERVDALRLAAFGCIWLGVGVFVLDAWRRSAQRLAA